MKKLLISVIFFHLFSIQALYCSNAGYAEWLERRAGLVSDPDVVRYYTFEGVETGKSTLKDLSGSGGEMEFVPYRDPETGKVYDDLEVIEGRWPEKNAVRLDRGWYRGPAVNIENKSFSAEVWFRRQGPGSIVPGSGVQNGTILGLSGYTRGWRIITSYQPPETLTFCIGQPGGCARTDAVAALPDNVWHHLAVTWDGREMKIYVNGEFLQQRTRVRDSDGQLAETDIFSGEYVETDLPFRIGFNAHGIGSVILDIDEVVIYDRALDSEEIKLLGRGPSGVSAPEVFSAAAALIEAGDYAGARREYGRLRGLPSYGEELALFNIAESYRLEKDYAGAHRTYSEIHAINGLSAYYRIYCLLLEGCLYRQQGNYENARAKYMEAAGVEGGLGHHVFIAGLKYADTFRDEKKHSRARELYKEMLVNQERLVHPHDGYRRDLINRLEMIDGLSDGSPEQNASEKRNKRLNLPEQALYLCADGSDSNAGTKESPLGSLKGARDAIRRLRSESGLPEGGITVYLRGGRYFIDESVVFGSEDAGTEESPVVYRSYPGEQARIIGGAEVKGFVPVEDRDILRRLPESARGKVWVADLKSEGIEDYGELLNRGFGRMDPPGALELIYNGKIMELARWPSHGWARIEGLTHVDGVSRNNEYQVGKFVYPGDRPERWLEEREIWVKGYLGVNQPYALTHMRVDKIDTEERSISLLPNTLPGAHPGWARGPAAKDHPFHVYNLLSEIEVPGEWYLDRDTGKLYFYPPGDIEDSEIIVSTLDGPFFSFQETSHVILYDITMEATRRNGIEIKGGRENLVAGSVIRNTAKWGVIIDGGFEHEVFGCDIYDTGEGGVSIDFVPLTGTLIRGRKKLVPARHNVENNHIYRFNRFCGGYKQALRIDGIGQRAAHNVIHDSPLQGIYFNANDHLIEYNEIHDVVHEGRELGAIYIYGEPWYLMSRGTVIRNNFFHHISYHSSPNLTHGLNAIHIDAINSGLVIEDNVFYRVPQGISNSQPENRIENNIFVDSEVRSVSQGNRWTLFNTPDGEPIYERISTWAATRLKAVNYKQPPWSWRYPQLVDILYREKPVGWSQNNFIERNVNTGGLFISIAPGIRDDNVIRNNWDGEEPMFIDRDAMDFRLRAGSPVYGLSGFLPQDTINKAGVYNDRLRASWPINRTPEDIGKYYKPDWMAVEQLAGTSMAPLPRVSEALEYEIQFTDKPFTIDGKLSEDLWEQADKAGAMVMEQHWDGVHKEGAKSYAWLFHDGENLYVGIKNESDPYKEGMPARMKNHIPLIEIAIESQHGAHSHGWWIDDMVTGPIYSFTFSYEGKLTVNNMFGMPYAFVRKIEESIEYSAEITDDENREWTAEIKIPLSLIGIYPEEAEKLAFNLGVSNRSGWFAWVATGQSIWRVENAGFISFGKK